MRSHSSASLAWVASVSLGAILGVSPVPSNAAIVTLDFEELRTVDTDPSHIVGQVYIHDGVRLTALPAPPPAEPTTRFLYAGTLSSSFAGSTMLRQGVDGAEIMLDLVNGGRFNLLSMDLAETPNFDSTGKPIGTGTFDVTFTGVRANGTEITETVTVDRFPTIDHFTFPGFAELTSVHWFQGGGFTPGFGANQFDNIRLVTIPEPATVWLIGLGMLMLALPRMARWRRGNGQDTPGRLAVYHSPRRWQRSARRRKSSVRRVRSARFTGYTELGYSIT